jgi:hypothetical protein
VPFVGGRDRGLLGEQEVTQATSDQRLHHFIARCPQPDLRGAAQLVEDAQEVLSARLEVEEDERLRQDLLEMDRVPRASLCPADRTR